MKITRSETKLVFTDFPWFFVLIFIGLGGGFLIQIANHYWHHHTLTHDEVIGGCVASVFLLVGVIIAQRSVFSFDRANRQLTWSRVNILGRKSGMVPFNQIERAIVESSADSKGTTYRVALKLTNDELPLSFMYTSGEGPRDAVICHEINELLGVATEVEAKDEEASIGSLVADGRLIDAIQRVRDMRRCSLADAKKIVEGMRDQSSNF